MATHALVAVAVLLAVCAPPGALAQTVQVWFLCSPANYTAGSPYGASVRSVLRDVVAAAGRSRYGYATVVRSPREEEEPPDGLALCYADAGPPEVCRLCLRMAAGNLTLACPGAASAAILYNNCLLQYTDSAAGGRQLARPEADTAQRFSFYNNNMSSAGEADRYGAALNRLMDRLAPAAAEAGANGQPRPVAAFGQTNTTANESLYGFAQCVAALSPAGCRLCLQRIAASLPMTKGGRAYSLTCYARFEVVPFYMPANTTRIVVAPARAPSSSSTSSSPAPEPSSSSTSSSSSSTSSSQPAANSSSSSSRASKHSKMRTIVAVSTVGIIVLVTTCIIIAFKIHRSGRFPLQSLVRKDYNSRRDKIKEMLGNYGSLAPKRYTFLHLKKITKSFSEKLGEGSYGMVYKGTLANGHHVAVKFLRDTTGNGEEFVNEVISIRRTSHVNIVTLLGFCLEGSKRVLVYDYMPNGSLERFIYAENSKETLEWDKLYEIALGIARGLEYLHRGCNTRIIHFDIKPQNILLDQEFVPKIADFGLAKLCNPKESYLLSMDGMRGTVGFIAPEVFSRGFGIVSTKSDVYSFGMVLLEMVGGRKNLRESVERESEVYFPDWVHSHLTQLGSLQSLDLGPDEHEEIAKKMATIGLWCIQISPASRPTISKVLEMFERNIDQLETPPKQFIYSPIQ
ncbi:LEAF RUST 10 DISEASE-RESISTANCE LOCUS RECEPTOR-LIKE PROTEIN KINASE-like 2.4 [Triticum dicoccoides]|uniref:LEAF RUST 10 DISEASE-RESISTANCE LOCUS RECEPTOR-LIKE PROTEIN KINASE-like 2.4 n=1 Tax=Triticum dicoccoides TaxID=85692 RepID=UPI00188FE1F4|nr:LEAF RUST 10 DISEASE-RESISTANCE LOCUS RECEPTOR-LIKE PROTEIN KINASE-like 2.4 [Triticum dicoccoides]